MATSLVACVLLTVVLPAGALVMTTITIDGLFSDWIGPRGDPENCARDTQVPIDPDFPGQPDRDTYLVAATYDQTYLYLAYRRTAGGVKAVTFGAYIDRGGDGLLQGVQNTSGVTTDVVAVWTVSSGQPYSSAALNTARIMHYHQADTNTTLPFLHPQGDPMGHDGETPDGWASPNEGTIAIPSTHTMDAWLDPTGIEAEARVRWDDLGLKPGAHIAIHFANGNGDFWGMTLTPSNTRKYTGNPPQWLEENRGQIEDNVDDIWWLSSPGVKVEPDNYGGAAAGSTTVYAHTVWNSGNTTMTYALGAVSSQGWPVSVTTTGGATLPSVTVGPGDTYPFNVRVTVPTGTPDGREDMTRITATSTVDSTVHDYATDITYAGRLAVFPDQEGSIAPSQTISYTFTVRNNQSTAGVFNLSTASALGFPTTIHSSSGTTITSVPLGANEATTVVVRVTAPSTATVGAMEVTRLTARQAGDPSIRSTAIAQTLVADGLAITPNNQSYAGAGTVVEYLHTITNSWPTTRTVNLSATSSRGWTYEFYDDDRVTRITTTSVGPFGATADVLLRVWIPAGTAVGIVDTTTVSASAAGSPLDTAWDRTTVRQLTTYDSPGYISQCSSFTLGDTVWARGTGLSPGSNVYFVWKNPSLAIIKTSPTFKVDEQGMAFNEYELTLGDPTGVWWVELYDSRGRLLESTPFTVGFSAYISELSATDAPGVGEDVAVTSSTRNESTRTITNSTMTYTIWWDGNGDGAFSAGDTYIDSGGAPHAWNGTATVSTHITTSITVGPNSTWTEPAPWTVNNALFPHQGTYHITAVWRESNGVFIDDAVTEFFSIPTLNWPMFLLVAFGGFAVLIVRMRGATPHSRRPAPKR